MRLPETKQREQGENMIPLINVVFLLLIFFMLAGALAMPEPFAVQPPAASSDVSLENRDWTLLLAASGELALDGGLLSLDELGAAVDRVLQEYPDAQLKLKADADVAAAALLEVMDVLRAAGAQRVTLLTQKASS